jgi:hypothetical protein
MAVGSGSYKGKGKSTEKKFPRGVCWNCGEKGHFKDKCTKPAKTTKDPKKEDIPKKTDSAHAAVESDSESEGVFAMISDTESMPDLEVLDFDDDWFTEEEEEDGELETSDRDDHSPGEAFVAMEPARTGQYAYVQAELYDSGCTKHISPYRQDLVDFMEILPKPFRAANKQSFSATGIGKLTVNLPNGAESSKLELTKVLYSPEVGYTLISVGNLDDQGFTVSFGGGKCVITNSEGEKVGEVPKNHKGLYRVEHDQETADLASDEITLDQFH